MARQKTALGLILTLGLTLLTPNSIALAPKRIAIAYDVGGRGDNGINDLASVGLENAMKKHKISPLDVREQITNGSLGDRITRVRFLAKNNYQLIICVGSAYADTVRRISNEYPNTQFAIIDDQSIAMTNVSNLSFATPEAIYLSGAALAVASKRGKIMFLASKSDLSAGFNASTFSRGALAVNAKIQIITKLINPNNISEIKADFSSGVDHVFSTYAESDAVISTLASFNAGSKKVLLSGVLPDQYFLNFSGGKKNQYLVVRKRYDKAVEAIIAAEIANKNILEILDPKKGIYGHRYNLKDGGVSVKLVSGAAFSAKVSTISTQLKAGRVANLIFVS